MQRCADLLRVEVAEVSEDELQHALGVDLLQIVLRYERDLEGKGCDFKFFSFILFESLCFLVAVGDDGCELRELRRY